MYSDILFFYNNRLADYDIEKLTGLKSARKFSAVIDFHGGMKRLVEYLTEFLSFNDDFFDVFVAVDETDYDIKRLANLFPNVSIIQFLRSQNFSKKMSVILDCIKSEYFLLINENFKLVKFDFKFLDKLFLSYKKPLCISPLIITITNQIIPNIRIPRKSGRMSVEVEYSFPINSVQNTLYPVLGIGVYDVKRLRASGGFSDMEQYYSVLDFFIRQWCCGLSCTFSDAVQFFCKNPDVLFENIDIDEMSGVNLNAFASKKEGESFVKINTSSLLVFDYKDVKRANERNKDYLYDYNMLVKNWMLYEDECIAVLKKGRL